MVRRQRTAVSIGMKKRIISMKLGSLELTLDELQANIREKFRIKINLSTISKVLSQQDSIMAQN